MGSKVLETYNALIADEEHGTTAPQPHPHPHESPPPYQLSNNDMANLGLNLSFTPLPLPPHPITLIMKGESRSPNFTVGIPLNPPAATTATAIPFAAIDTDSSQIHHHTHIHDARPGGVMYTLKRQVLSAPSAPTVRESEWRYSIWAHGRDGARLLEVTTSPDLLGPRAASTRLVFRRADDGELDALTLKTRGGAMGMVVEYQGARVGEIVLLGGKREKPVLRIEVEVGGVDPLLLVVLALVLDDRWMSDKRRFKREFGRGLRGIGRGPGAGLAGAYALGSVV